MHPCSLDHCISEASRGGDLCTAWVGQSQGRLNTYVPVLASGYPPPIRWYSFDLIKQMLAESTILGLELMTFRSLGAGASSRGVDLDKISNWSEGQGHRSKVKVASLKNVISEVSDG